MFVVVGTRPEAIKLAPVIAALRATSLPVTVCATGQHRALLDAALADFGVVPDLDLNLMRDGQRPEAVVAAALPALAAAIEQVSPAAVIVQGDTASAFAGALAGAYAQLPVVHVEAGLRTYAADPFPEEFQRRAIAPLALLHFAPTAAAAAALRREGIAADGVHLVGNTGIDAVRLASARLAADPGLRAVAAAALPRVDPAKPLLLVTVHRRENHGDRLAGIVEALVRLHRRGVEIVVPVHPNPEIRRLLTARLGRVPGIHLVPPLPYFAFVTLLGRARAVLTDSGGVQEEAPALGVPVLVLRDHSERPEGIAAGSARLVGTDPASIDAAVAALFADEVLHARMAQVRMPYGDGHAAERIAAILARRFSADVGAEVAQAV